MNLYRSFGNLMETWITGEDSCPDMEWLRHNGKGPPTPSSEMDTNLRSESVDSGVETASCDTSFPATSCSALTENTEMEREELSPASTSQSPVFSSPKPSSSSSSSLRLCSSRAMKDSSALHLKLEQALQRTDSRYLKTPEALTTDELLRHRFQAPFLLKRHTSELIRGQRSNRFGLGRTLVSIQQTSETCRRPQSMTSDMQRSEGNCTTEKKELSPGFTYLEQVCQMLEDIAKQQMHSQTSEADALREHQDIQASQVPDTSQSNSPAGEEDATSCHRLENTINAEQVTEEHKQRKYGHFRQRSASDTALASMHLKKVNAGYRGQHVSTADLLEEEEDHENQEFTKEETNKTKKNWRIKLGYLRRHGSAASDTKSQQTQSSEKSSTRRRLSQLFRRREKAA